jgi:hypothetical protein
VILLGKEFFDRMEVLSKDNYALRELLSNYSSVSFGFFFGRSEEGFISKEVPFDQDILFLPMPNFDRIQLFWAHFCCLSLNGVLLLQLSY